MKNMRWVVVAALFFILAACGSASAATYSTGLTLSLNPSTVYVGNNVTLTAHLTYIDSKGHTKNLANQYVTFDINGTKVTEQTNTGGIATYTCPIFADGIYNVDVTFNGASADLGNNYAAAFSGIKTVIHDTTPPTVTANTKGGLYNAAQSVTLSATDNIDSNPSVYYTTNGSNPTTSSAKYTGPISIISTTVLRFMAVDLAGNPSTVYSQTYTIDKIPPKVISTYPKRYATGVSRTRTIYLKFSEKIKSSVNWSKVYVKNLKTGKKISISKLIKGNLLYIKTSKRSAYTWYQVYIPAYAIKDYAGNKLAKGYTWKFKTGKY